MSDYLWDKSGDGDAEVERLEELLGRLRDTRGAPEIAFAAEEVAFGAGPQASTRASLLRRAFDSRPARLAAAAALLLAALAGALVMLRQPKPDAGGLASTSKENQSVPRQAGMNEQARAASAESHPNAESQSNQSNRSNRSNRSAASAESAKGNSNVPAHDLQRRGSTDTAQSFPKTVERRSSSPREAVAGSRTREAREAFTAAASVTNTPRVPGAAPARVGSGGRASDFASRVRAKEQLVYALKLTSEAFREVRGRAAGSDPRAESFDGRNPFR